MAEMITYQTKSGETAHGALGIPAGGEKAPAVVLVQEWWGLDAHIKSLVDRLSAAGFVVLAPDLYDGVAVAHENPGEAGKLAQGLDGAKAMDKIAGAVAFLSSHAATTGKVGITGFCMGGAYSIAAAATVPGLSAAVPFYGIPDLSKFDLSKITAPLQGHFAKNDGHISPEKVELLSAALAKAGKSIELHMYDADHAFLNDTRPAVYNAGEATKAWDRAVAFLKKHLA